MGERLHTYHFQPSLGQCLLVPLDGEDPLSSLLVGRVLPQGLDTLLEEVVVAVLLHVVWLCDVVVELPENLDLVRTSIIFASHTCLSPSAPCLPQFYTPLGSIPPSFMPPSAPCLPKLS